MNDPDDGDAGGRISPFARYAALALLLVAGVAYEHRDDISRHSVKRSISSRMEAGDMIAFYFHGDSERTATFQFGDFTGSNGGCDLLARFPGAGSVFLADYDGDGRTDVVETCGVRSFVNFRQASGCGLRASPRYERMCKEGPGDDSGYVISFRGTVPVAWGRKDFNHDHVPDHFVWMPGIEFLFIDENSDGRTDLVVRDPNGIRIYPASDGERRFSEFPLPYAAGSLPEMLDLVNREAIDVTRGNSPYGFPFKTSR